MSDESSRPDYRHTVRLFGALAVVVAVAVVVRFELLPAFGYEGSLRDARAAARAPSPRYQGRAACAACHPEQAALHGKDAHATVQCEDCHGAGRAHAEFYSAAGRAGRKKAPPRARLARPAGKGLCLTCHRRLAARPPAFAQIDVRQHYAFVGVKSAKTPCTRCHSPHEPLFMDRDLRSARLHPLVHRCRDCHAGSDRGAARARPAGHPAIFECSYCHEKIVEDFSRRPHKKIRCTTCHLFFKQSEFAGRIIRDAAPRFCLLCHRGGAFRSSKAPPGISWPSHREDMSDGPEDAKKGCIDCHQDKIHAVGAAAHGAAAASQASRPAATKGGGK